MTIATDRLIFNCYHKELHLRYCRGPRSFSAYTRKEMSDRMEFSHLKLKHKNKTKQNQPKNRKKKNDRLTYHRESDKLSFKIMFVLY